MIALELADLVLIASRTLGLDTGQVLDLVDVAAAENALAAARPGSESAGPALRAAALLHALVCQRPLRRGNQQVALAAMLQFLAVNGWDMDPDPPGPVAAMVAALAAGTAGTRDAAALLAPRLRPGNQHGRRGHDDHPKEAPMRPRPALPLAGKFRPRPALSLAGRTRNALLAPRRTRVYPRGFTDRHKQAVDLAMEQARQLGHDYLGTEHLLLGLLAAGDGVAVQVLASTGIPVEEVRSRVEGIISGGHVPGTRAVPVLPTPQARRVLGLTMREALALGHNEVGTGHLLLALLREGHGVAAQVLTALGADHARVREQVAGLIASADEQAGPQTWLVRVAIPAGLADAAEQLAQVQRQRKAARDAEDLAAAAALRDREDQLRADKLRLEQQWAAGVDVQAVVAENQRVHRELDRMRGLLREHGIEPDGGAARTA
jgi:Clp amino terminal domain, pathogenicity island component